MTYQSLQTLSQIAIAAGLIISALGGYGAYYYDKKVDEEKVKKEKVQEMLKSEKDTLPLSRKETSISVQKNEGVIIGEQTNNYSQNIPVPRERPIIDLCRRGINVEQINETTALFDIPYCSGKNANAYNVKLQTAIILKVQDKLHIAAPFDERFPDDISLSYETGKSITYKLYPYTQDMMEQTYIYVIGSFTNDDESKKYPVSDLFKYNTHSKTWIRTVGDEDEKIRNFLKPQHIL